MSSSWPILKWLHGVFKKNFFIFSAFKIIKSYQNLINKVRTVAFLYQMYRFSILSRNAPKVDAHRARGYLALILIFSDSL